MTNATTRVALVAPFGLRPKGTASARVLPIARVLVRQGAQVRVVIPPWDDPWRAGQRWTWHGVEIVHARLGRGLGSAARILTDVLRAADDFQPDVVHAFKPIGFSGAAALWFRHRRPRVRVAVDTDDLEGPAGWAGRTRQGWRGALRGIQERHVLRNVDLVSTASHWLAQYAGWLGVRPAATLVVTNGIDPPTNDRPHPTSAGKAYKEPTLATGADAAGPLAGRPTAGNAPVLLWYTRFTEATPQRAAGLLGPLLRSPAAPRLAILGEEVNSGDQAALARALAAEGVAQQVDWLGYGPELLAQLVRRHHGRLIAIYPMDDDLVNRARCPSKVPQLMALGVPVVGEGVGEFGRYLAGFEEDCVVRPGDAAGFRARVANLVSNPEHRAAVAMGLRNAAPQWSWDRTIAPLLSWYTGW